MTINHFYVYILTSYNGNAMYVGFTKQYRVHKLVYYEVYEDLRAAIEREKQLKGWRREKKNQLVETANPEWKELLLFDEMW